MRGQRKMLFMVIEHYKDGNAEEVYRRLQEEGRTTPDGLTYIDGWAEANFARCFQVVECDDARMIQRWIAEWDDLMEFEVVPIVSSEEPTRIITKTKGIATDGSSENGDG